MNLYVNSAGTLIGPHTLVNTSLSKSLALFILPEKCLLVILPSKYDLSIG
jgi:hypothetical protein